MVRFNGFVAKTMLFNSSNMITPIKPQGLEVEDDFSIRKDLGIYCIGDIFENKEPTSTKNARIQA